LIKNSRVWGAAVALLLLGSLLSACGAAPLPQNWPGLTVADGVVYANSGSPQRVYMLDSETGVQKATFMPTGTFRGQLYYWSPVTVGDEMAFVGFASPQDKLYGLFAFDPLTGQELWRVQADNLILAAPVYADGVVYFGTSSGQVYAVDTATRNVKPGWSFQAKEAIWGSPLVIGDRVYVPTMDHYLYCLDANTGQEVWKFKAGGALAAQPSPNDSTLYQGALDGRVYAVETGSGLQVSGFDFQAKNWIWSEVLVDAGRLYVASLDGKLYALDAATGQVLPGYPYSTEATDYVRAAPVQSGEMVVIATGNGRLVALNSVSGQMQWQWPTGGQTPVSGILTTPVASNGRVYILLTNGQVYALDAATGLQLPGWPFPPSVTQQ
jgi:outer membrane protein assembly factor BamB